VFCLTAIQVLEWYGVKPEDIGEDHLTAIASHNTKSALLRARPHQPLLTGTVRCIARQAK
jgi:hypothetical protein